MNRHRLVMAMMFLLAVFAAAAMAWLLVRNEALGTATFAALVGGGAIFAEPYTGLVAYLLFLYVRPQDYVAALQGLPVMLAISGATLGLMVLRMAVKDRGIRLVRAPQNAFVAWFVLAIGLSHLSRAYVSGAVSETLDFLPTAVMYVLIANLVAAPGRVRTTVNLVVILTLVLAAQGLVQHFTGQGFGGQTTYKGRIQAVGIFSDPNDLALALVIALPYVYLKLVERHAAWQKPLAALAMGVLLWALFLTQSRGGLLAFGVLMMMLFSRRFGKGPGIALGGAIMLAVVLLGPRMSTISTEEASAYGRVQAWGIGIDLFEQYPLFGVGAGQFTEYHFRTAHNSVVLCAAELGMFGLYPWVMIIWLTIRSMAFVRDHLAEVGLGDLVVYAESVRYGTIAFVLAAYFLSRTYSELLFVLAGIAAALVEVYVARTGERFVLVERRDWVLGLALMVGGWLFTKGFLYVAW